MRQVYETPTPQRKIKSDTLPQSFTLTAEHVRFNYHQEGRRFIEDLNLEIPAGQHVAIVGESGSGKSSLARLFPDSGSRMAALCGSAAWILRRLTKKRCIAL